MAIVRDITERKKARKELKKSKERKDFLNTLLRQDLGSKYRTIHGYLQLLEEEVAIPQEKKKYLEKAMKAGKEADEILGLAKKLQEIEKADPIFQKDINQILNQVIKDISSFLERQGIKIEKNYPDNKVRVEGDYSLNVLFSQILLTRAQTSKCNIIKINVEEKEERILVTIEDEGEPITIDVKNIFSGKPYTGETTGVGGVRYYIIREIARHNNAKIEVQDQELDGTKFYIRLMKA